MIARAEVREARSLDRLLHRLVEESREGDTPFAIEATGKVLALAFVWLLPVAAPVLVWRGEPGLAVFAAFFGIFLPAAYRSSERTERDEALRLHGPSGEAVWLSRFMGDLPWIAWAALAAAAIPLAHAVRSGADLTRVAIAAAFLTAALPLVRLTKGEGGPDLGGVRRMIESVAPLLFAVTLGILYKNWDPAAAQPLARELQLLVTFTLACTTLALASRAARRLAPTATWGIEDEDTGSSRPFQPVDMGIPRDHAPVRTALGLELTLARLTLEHKFRAARSVRVKLLLAFSLFVSAVFPVVLGALCVLLLGDERAGSESVVSLLGLWLGMLFLGASRELRADDWMRGVNWRTQLGFGWLKWATMSMIPAAIGCAWALHRAGASEQTLSLAALVLAGAAVRGHYGGVRWLVPDSSDPRRWVRIVPTALGIAHGLVMVGLPVAHLFDFRVEPRVGFYVAGGAAVLALIGAASDLFLRTEDALADEFADELDSWDDEEDEE
ncbi:MAG: hypothetical protein AAF957_07245 [Planctomycetota bacterium]